MKVYVINLDRQPERLAHIGGLAAKGGFEFERIRAVDGKELRLDVASWSPGSMLRRPLTVGEYACMQSHRQAWQRICERDDPYGLVLEDDVLLSDGFADLLKSDWLPRYVDIVRLDTTQKPAHLAWRKKDAPKGKSICRLRSTHLSAGAYIVARKTAGRLLRETENAWDAVDQIMFDDRSPVFQDMDVYQMVPAVAIQAYHMHSEESMPWSKSSLEGERLEAKSTILPGQRATFKGRLWWAKRRLKGLGIGARFSEVPYSPR